MVLRHLRLRDFRNLASVDLDLPTGLLVLEGENGQGKTSLLEAMACLAWGRSFRTSHDRILVRQGGGGFHVEGRVSTRNGEKTISLGYEADRRRIFRQGGTDLSRRGGALSDLKIVLFTPEDLGLLKGGPESRRRYLDWDLGQADPVYRDTLQRYYHVLRQRNRLLYQGRSRPLPEAELEPWSTALAESAVEVVRWRQQVIFSLQETVVDLHRALTGREGMGVAYLPQYTGALEAKDFQRHLQRLAAAERRRGTTLLGPHRDDLRVTLGERDLRLFGSQGEQRTVAIVLKQAALAFLTRILGETPLLLLDDVLSELDPHRREALLERTPAAQTVLTTAEPLRWPPVATRLRIRSGCVLSPEAGI